MPKLGILLGAGLNFVEAIAFSMLILPVESKKISTEPLLSYEKEKCEISSKKMTKLSFIKNN